MYAFIAHRRFIAAHAKEAIEKTQKICQLCQKQQGLVSIQVYCPDAAPNELYLVEQWDNEQVFKQWIDSDEFKKYLASVAEFDAGLHVLPATALII